MQERTEAMWHCHALACLVRAHRVTGKVLGVLGVSGSANAVLARARAVHGSSQG